MKLILSRKGIDSSAGGFASPIFSDGSMLSIAIPDKRSPIRYRDLNSACDGRVQMSTLVKHLSNGRVTGKDAVHLDPDLMACSVDRNESYQPLFGQCGAAQSHLESHSVGRGDLFLFFGWFREVEFYKKRWRYVSGAPDRHVLYGWLQINQVVAVEKINCSSIQKSAVNHPHCHGEFSGTNSIYSAAKTLSLKKSLPGAGVFNKYLPQRCLSAENCSRSIWHVPAWMHPQGRDSALSYHSDPRRWSHYDETKVQLRSAARGQEFVLNLDHYPEGKMWVKDLFAP